MCWIISRPILRVGGVVGWCILPSWRRMWRWWWRWEKVILLFLLRLLVNQQRVGFTNTQCYFCGLVLVVAAANIILSRGVELYFCPLVSFHLSTLQPHQEPLNLCGGLLLHNCVCMCIINFTLPDKLLGSFYYATLAVNNPRKLWPTLVANNNNCSYRKTGQDKWVINWEVRMWLEKCH